MPIYAYRCATCGYAKDVLQKISDPVLSVCPNCGAATFTKQVTAAGFQLKGSGWYVTDFRGDNKAAKPAGDAPAAPAAAEGSAAAPSADKAAASSDSKPAAADKGTSDKPAPAAPATPTTGGQ